MAWPDRSRRLGRDGAREGSDVLSRLITTPNLNDADATFELLVSLHDGLDREESLAAFGRLVVVLANHIGDETVIRDAVAVARAA